MHYQRGIFIECQTWDRSRFEKLKLMLKTNAQQNTASVL